MEERRTKEMKLRRRATQVLLGYLDWQAVFPLVALIAGWLTPEQMGFTLRTVPLGILVGVIILAATFVFAKWTQWALWLMLPGLKHVDTREEFERFWEAALAGCDDGTIAETHWSGTILPLLMILFESIIGIPYPFNVIPAIFTRWLAHVGAHVMIPRGGQRERAFGGIGFFAVGLLISDVKNSLAFLISGSIVAPVMLHHLDSYVTTWAGNKERVAKALGITLSTSSS